MAAGQFLKVAAAQLRRASQILKQEAQSMLAERERTARQKSSEITNHQLQLRAKQATLYDPSKQNAEKQRTAKEVQNLQQAINAKQQEIVRANQQLAGAAQSKQSKASNLEIRARDLESQASSPDLAG
jgi:hypothetical protein